MKEVSQLDWISLEKAEVAQGLDGLWYQPHTTPLEVPFETPYDKIDALRNSEMGYMLKGLDYWDAWKKGKIEKPETAALLEGSISHQLVLEPEKDITASGAAIIPDEVYSSRSKNAQEIKRFHKKKGLQIIKQSQLDEIQSYADAARNDRRVQKLLKGAMVEKELYWHMADYGIDAKMKADAIVPGSHLLDLKFVREPQTFGRLISSFLRDYHYDRQMAWYLTGAIANGLLTPECDVWLIAIVKSPPYVVMPFKLSAATLLKGKSKFEKIISMIASYNANRKFNVKFFHL